MIDAKPIIFSGPMVRAILEGRKSMTRRVLKPQPTYHLNGGVWYRPFQAEPHEWHFTAGGMRYGYWKAPYAEGDTLWVRENWRAEDSDMDHIPPNRVPRASQIFYEVDGSWGKDVTVGKLRPSIHMPRWASRITLTVGAVKVERLQDISEEDCSAEGIVGIRRPRYQMDGYGVFGMDQEEASMSRFGAFEKLWQSINAKRAPWDSNPWVVAYTFKPIPG